MITLTQINPNYQSADELIKELSKYFVPAVTQAILRELELSDMTAPSLTKKIRAERSAVHRALKNLLNWNFVHIVDWIPPPQSGAYTPLYRLGNGTNKRKPGAKTNAEVCANYRSRHKIVKLGAFGL